MTVFPSLIKAEVNMSIMSTCIAEGGPDNQFSWRVMNGAATTLQEGPVFIIDVVSVSVGGVYSCFVENNAGSDEAHLTVYGE